MQHLPPVEPGQPRGPKKRSTSQEYPFVRWMFPSGGIRNVDQDRREKAGLLPRAGRGPGTAQNQSI